MKAIDRVGLVGPALAVVLWLLSRWVHDVLRCLRGAGAGAFALNECAAILERPTAIFDSWLVVTMFSAGWGVFLMFKGRRIFGACAIGGSLGVLGLAGAFM